MSHKNLGTLEDFQKLVDVRGPDECWLFKGALTHAGYGNYRSRVASRVAYLFAHRELPEGKEICHTCDQRNCVNPAHLFAGSHRDNCIDMVKKGRHVGSRKLSKEQVAQIRKRKRDGISAAVIAKEFGIVRRHVHALVRGDYWRDDSGNGHV